jgi:carboxypeptidase C (cathepsin A)
MGFTAYIRPHFVKNMLRIILLSASLVGFVLRAESQADPSAKDQSAKDEKIVAYQLVLNIDSSVTTHHDVVIRGQHVPYTATAGTMPVWDDHGKPLAGVFYTYYERSDIKDFSSRPLVISFNGGPGTPSVWMEIGYTGPRRLNVDDEGYPLQPYGLQDNANSILDVADIVYVDPVNTGYSRPINYEIPASKFFGVNEDIKYLADWISTFVTRKNRWASPKFLIGESYGTTRVSGLALALQDDQWMYLNGVILISPTELGISRSGPVDIALHLPYYAATAWYHKALSADLQQKDLLAILPEVEDFTINKLIPAISKGGFLDEDSKRLIASQMAAYSGLSQKVILQHNLNIPTDFFWKELLRDKGYTVGRLDSRYKGIDRQAAGEGPDFNAELTSWLHSFTPAMHIYLRDELNYKSDLKYNMFGSVYPWDEKNDRTGENLRQAIAENPSLNLLIQSGYYDGACDYFNAKYSMWQLDPSGRLKDRLTWEGYRSGHMLYLRKEDLAVASQHLRDFILKSVPKPGEPVKY